MILLIIKENIWELINRICNCISQKIVHINQTKLN